jgi:peptidyl-prolyl cis-trans isomerase D
MLDSIRKRKDNLVYTMLILAIVAVMGLYGIGQMGDKPGQHSGPAAYVNGEMISMAEFSREYGSRLQQYQSMLGAQYDEKLLMQLHIPERTLDDMVQSKLLAQQATKMGIVVPDRELAEFIRSLPYYQKDGKFDSETYAKLPNRGTEETSMRERLQIQRFHQYLTGRIKATPADLRAAHQLKDTKVDIEYAKIDFNQVAALQKPSAAEVAATLKATTETELKEFYDSHVKDFSTPEKRLLRQIRVGVPFKASDEQRAAAKKKIDAIAAETKPENFDKVASAKSDDEYAKKGGTIGWVNKGTLEEPLERALDTLAVKSVSPPVETQFGYFLLMVDDKKPEVVEPFEKAKTKIGEKIASEKAKKDFGEKLRKQWEEALASGKSIDAELKKYKVETKKTGPFSVGTGYVPQVGNVDAILDGVFALSKDKPVAPKLFYNQEHYYYLKLASVEYPKEGSLAKDRDVIERGAVSPLQNELMNQWISDLQKQATVKTELKFDTAPTSEQM